MKIPVMLSICGRQSYKDQDPDVIELVTEGTLEQLSDGWEILYNESSLTGMEGVTTSFYVKQDGITLTRSGKLNSQMIFKLGQPHESLYKMEFGALLLSVCATDISWDLTENGGTVDLVYNIDIEQNAAGKIDYHLDIKKMGL